MARYKLSPEERAAEKERKENLRNIMRGRKRAFLLFLIIDDKMPANGFVKPLVDKLYWTAITDKMSVIC